MDQKTIAAQADDAKKAEQEEGPRARSFFAWLCGYLDKADANKLAEALGFEHLAE